MEDRGGDGRREAAGQAPAQGGPAEDGLPDFKSFRRVRVDALERDYLQRLAGACGGDPALARRISGFSKTRLYELLKKHGLTLSGQGSD